MKNSRLEGIYIGDTGFNDGCTKGLMYTLEDHSDDQYLVHCNDHGAKSFLNKNKFIVKGD